MLRSQDSFWKVIHCTTLANEQRHAHAVSVRALTMFTAEGGKLDSSHSAPGNIHNYKEEVWVAFIVGHTKV